MLAPEPPAAIETAALQETAAVPYDSAVAALVKDEIAAPIEAEYAARFARDHAAAQAGCPTAAKAFIAAVDAIETILPRKQRFPEMILLGQTLTVRGLAERMGLDRQTTRLRLGRGLASLLVHYRRVNDAPSPAPSGRPV